MKSGWVDLNNLFCISVIQRFSGFPHLLTTFPKDVRLSGPQQIFFLSHLYTTLSNFLTCWLLFRRMSGWVYLNKICFVSRLVDFRLSLDTENDFRKGSPTRVLANKFVGVSLLIDLGFGIWPRKWLPVWVTHSSSNQKQISCYSFISPWMKVHPMGSMGSPTWVLAKK